MHDLLERLVWPAFGDTRPDDRHDGAVVSLHGTRIAFTTDTYVVHPHFFPGGDIGSLAVHGTVNDLAMCGARPAYLSAGLVLEEGFPVDSLRRILDSMGAAARAAGVEVVTGDTKVVDRGKGDGIFVNTAGIGLVETPLSIAPASVRAGDAVLVSGDLGRHGVAILSAREGLEFETLIQSDTAPLHEPVAALLHGGVEVHCLRDLTRGGLASALVEIAEAAQLGIEVEDAKIPVPGEVRAACEILGLDPLYVANEGRFVALVPEPDAELAVEILRRQTVSRGSVRVGRVTASPRGRVALRTSLGTSRIVEMFSGEQLPRIC
jgi:hydrogenase expression/formation protein HypE